jgi:hypothetical protein
MELNLEKPMIIKTNSLEQIELAQKLRDLIKAGTDVVLVPFSVTNLRITIEDDELVVISESDLGPFDFLELDTAKGFESLAECREYARIVIKEAGLPEDSYKFGVWERNKLTSSTLKEGVAL